MYRAHVKSPEANNCTKVTIHLLFFGNTQKSLEARGKVYATYFQMVQDKMNNKKKTVEKKEWE